MGKGNGITAHGMTSIKISFQWRGLRCRETLSIEPTPANLKYATRLKAEIERKIEVGNFNYAEYFPKSKKLKQLGIASEKETLQNTFFAMSQRWLTASSHLQTGTLKKYKEALNFWLAKIGTMPIRNIKYSLLAGLANSQSWGPKTRNNMLTPLRQVFDLAFLDGVIETNPTERIKNSKVQKEPPDPLTALEVEKVLDYLKRYPQQVGNYFRWAFFTGLRPSESIALKWGDVDWSRGLVRVCRAKTFQEIKETKTYKVRDVELSSQALTALKAQKPFTFLKDHGFIFENPVTGAPYHEERPLRRAYWVPTLKALGMRHRDAYQTRHTYATLCLMAGANPMWVSKQLGHANMQMLLTVYSKWIDGADKSGERDKVDALFGDDSAIIGTSRAL
ncbi:MAG: DUF3596 domain-containing protein [Spirochaetales bacterium]|nr:DUF3596 domain-containing protein [Spirochaetales bacterium]